MRNNIKIILIILIILITLIILILLIIVPAMRKEIACDQSAVSSSRTAA